jgi:hypothetical protein
MEVWGIIIAIAVVWFFISYVKNFISDAWDNRQNLQKTRTLLNETVQKLRQLEAENGKNISKIKAQDEIIADKDRLYKTLHQGGDEALNVIATLISDFQTLQYEISAKYLQTKKHPAHSEAKRIRELKEQTKETIYRSKLIQYKYEYLFSLFPDLEIYVDNIESINELSQFYNLGEIKNEVDRTRYYLSKEEYQELSENERNQLALDRYIKSQKSKWEIGRDYELFIGYEYSKDAWNVEYFGIEKSLNDMGRDLIAKKDGDTHIVQCKYWSQSKEIHEKHIAQLFGTTVQYTLSQRLKKDATPVFITNINLSETAKMFADYLGVEIIERKEIQDFPRIKCNLNTDEFGSETKIYHLPMDQQYDRTKIVKQGEFFAYTVNEAVEKGFRRAYRWRG